MTTHVLLFGFSLHWGEPRNPIELRGEHSVYRFSMKDRPASPWRCSLTRHRVGAWYGVSYREKWVLALMLFSRTARTSGASPELHDGLAKDHTP